MTYNRYPCFEYCSYLISDHSRVLKSLFNCTRLYSSTKRNLKIFFNCSFNCRSVWIWLTMPSNFQTGCGTILLLVTLSAILITATVLRIRTNFYSNLQKDLQTKTGWLNDENNPWPYLMINISAAVLITSGWTAELYHPSSGASWWQIRSHSGGQWTHVWGRLDQV